MKRGITGVLALLSLFCAGCASGAPQEATGQYALYFLQEDVDVGSSYNSSMTVELPLGDSVTAARRLIDLLLSGQEQAGALSPFPSGVQLLDCTLSGTTLTVDLSEEYGQLSGIALTEADYCLVLTLCQLEGVDGVELLLEGRPMPGRPEGVLTADQAVQAGTLDDPVSLPVQLFYPNAAGDALDAEYLVLTTYGDTPKAQCLAILNALPLRSGGRGETYPEEVFSSRSVTVENGVCELWLPDSWRDYFMERETIWRDGLAQSLCQVDGVDAVRLHTAEKSPLDGRLLEPDAEEANE